MPRILVSIHDVWPGNFAQVDRELEWLRHRSVMASALMVVPCYHGKRPIEEEPAFLEWIKGQMGSGIEIFGHGYRHLRSESFGEPVKRAWWGSGINRTMQNEAEFAGLSPKEADVLIHKSLGHFRKAGLLINGWVFPTWWGRIPRNISWPATCRFFDSRFVVTNLPQNQNHWAPALTFGVLPKEPKGGFASGGQQNPPFAYGGKFWQHYLMRAGLIRIALHPGDLDQTKVQEQVEFLLQKGKAVSYENVL